MKALGLLIILLSCATEMKRELAPLPLSFEAQLKSQFHRIGGKAELRNDVIKEKRVAVFDWDNTMIKNDIGDATFFWMIEHNLFVAPKNWENTSPFLSKKAINELNRHCTLKRKGKQVHLSTSSGNCGKTLLSIYADGVVSEDAPAWDKSSKLFNKLLIEPGYAWAASLLAGHTPEDVKEIAGMTIDHFLKQPLGAKLKLHGKEYAGFLRIYQPMKMLVDYLKHHNVTPWVVSASEQHLVEAFAERVGIPAHHVIGIRPVLQDGVLTSQFEACGPFPQNNQQIITYRKGKRCWANKIIFKVDSPKDQIESPAPIFFGAGDSDTDLEFLQDSEIKLVINRNKAELMCHALANLDNKWFVTPMFIEPKPKKTAAYDCTAWDLPSRDEL
ncbi:MAG: hypothetical protein A2X86_16870 [Bdellovibrionales bacterium GWA2_49_15]|nr:MAG: hypothetical protein A2X86_16870 [Bdellovibrionales bacterium GWA2_49_15]HAZ12452.1 hypothetical protein [Bdellovibrionales bacterium]